MKTSGFDFAHQGNHHDEERFESFLKFRKSFAGCGRWASEPRRLLKSVQQGMLEICRTSESMIRHFSLISNAQASERKDLYQGRQSVNWNLPEKITFGLAAR